MFNFVVSTCQEVNAAGMEASNLGQKKTNTLADPALVAEHVLERRVVVARRGRLLLPAAAGGAGVLIGVFNFVVKLGSSKG